MLPVLCHFDWRQRVSNCLLDVNEGFDEIAENMNQKVVDTLSKYKLDVARPPVSW